MRLVLLLGSIGLALLTACGGRAGSTGTDSQPLPAVVPSGWAEGQDQAALTDGDRAPLAAPGVSTPPGAASARPTTSTTGGGSFGEPLRPAGGIPLVDEGPAPVGLRLPTIGVAAARVVDVGVEADGQFEVPEADQVGWYRYGAAPGEEGSTVLAAHIAADGRDGVFRYLHELTDGDRIEVVDADGAVRPYEIIGLGEFPKDELPFDELFDRTGPSRLVLITCGGDFNPQLSSYDSNVVAFAVPLPIGDASG